MLSLVRTATKLSQIRRSAKNLSVVATAKISNVADDVENLPKGEISADEYRKVHQINITGTDGDFAPITDFSLTPFNDKIKKKLLDQGFNSPTPTQAQSWAIALQKRDLISIARTGSGKTLGFLLPSYYFMTLKNPQSAPSTERRRSSFADRRMPRLLVLAPTRELSVQIMSESEKYAPSCGLKSICLYGGVSRNPQMSGLQAGVDIVVGTPGRVNDMIEAGYLNLDKIDHFVLDEADRMLDMGFEPQIRQIVSYLPPTKQTLFFTATWPKEVRRLAGDFVKDPVMLQIGDTDQLNANKNITQKLVFVRPFDKQAKVYEILENINNDPDKNPKKVPKTIMFVGRKSDCDMLADMLYRDGYSADSLHGDKSQAMRDRVMDNFRRGQIRILVATDVAARGLDVKDIEVVINYDFPTNGGAEDYVHRIGRTGRGDMKTGVAYTLLTQADGANPHFSDLLDVVRRCNQPIPPEILELQTRGNPRMRPKMSRYSNGGNNSMRSNNPYGDMGNKEGGGRQGGGGFGQRDRGSGGGGGFRGFGGDRTSFGGGNREGGFGNPFERRNNSGGGGGGGGFSNFSPRDNNGGGFKRFGDQDGGESAFSRTMSSNNRNNDKPRFNHRAPVDDDDDDDMFDSFKRRP